ncbi:Hypothetical predicted protein [Paramuricea clavata]|uniref:Uncharacterized protein n=1 Tax=Paramuricea clavata TaxID=317549 RepID=A0A7D9DBN1_PARCT|nr:Hypothetical predicted protein [Paramuricea clavata]
MTQIKAENVQLKREVNELNAKVSKLEEEQENINSYSRRDCLEFHEIPQNSTENTDELVKRVANLIGVEINPYDISISHRLPSRRGSTPPIIAKFTKRRTKEIIYQSKRKLKSRNSSDIDEDETEERDENVQSGIISQRNDVVQVTDDDALIENTTTLSFAVTQPVSNADAEGNSANGSDLDSTAPAPRQIDALNLKTGIPR